MINFDVFKMNTVISLTFTITNSFRNNDPEVSHVHICILTSQQICVGPNDDETAFIHLSGFTNFRWNLLLAPCNNLNLKVQSIQ